MDYSALIKGIIAGFAIAAPIGPVSILCARRTMNNGTKAGFMTGLGAASMDAVFAAIVAFSLTYISNFLLEFRSIFHSIGSIILIILAYKIYYAEPEEKIEDKELTPYQDYLSAFMLTASNPVTMLAFIALLGNFHIHPTFANMWLVVVGAFVGSTIWWSLLIQITKILHSKLEPKTIHKINRISGICIGIFGFAILARVLIHW